MKTAKSHDHPLLADVLPSLAAELTGLLGKAGRADLATQVPALRVKSRCRCGDDFCATIYTRSGRPYDSIDLEPTEGMIIVEIDAAQRILGVEILYRDEFKGGLDALFPPGPRRTAAPRRVRSNHV